MPPSDGSSQAHQPEQPEQPEQPAQATARWRAARRAAALEHHPDRGGDADRLQAALAEVDRRFGRPGPGSRTGPGSGSSSGSGSAGSDRRPPVTVRRTTRGRARSLVARLVRRRRPRRTTLR